MFALVLVIVYQSRLWREKKTEERREGEWGGQRMFGD